MPAKQSEPRTAELNGKPSEINLALSGDEGKLLYNLLRQVNFPDPFGKQVAAAIQLKIEQAADYDSEA